MLSKTSPKSYSYFAGIFTLLIGFVVLIGWQFNIESLKSILPNAVSMKANTATLFVLSGISLILIQQQYRYARKLVQTLSSVIILVGLLSLLETVFGLNFRIDEIIFREPTGAIGTLRPGLMAPYTALNFQLTGFALLFLTLKRYKERLIMDFIVVFPLSISVIGLFGYLTGYIELAGPVAFTKMAIHTAIAFFVLCTGIFFTLYSQRNRSINIEQRLFLGLTVSSVIIIYISLLSISGIQSINKANENVEHVLQLKQELTECLSLVVDVETGSRGYLISGDESYSEPLKKASDNLPALLKSIRHHLNNIHQQNDFISLEYDINERIEIANKLYYSRQTEGHEIAILKLLNGKGKQLTDSIRVRIAHIVNEEDNDFQIKNLVEKIQTGRTQTIIIGSIAIQMLLLILIFLILRRDINGRKMAEIEVRGKNEQLEELNAEKDKLFSIIAHDLRSPFNSFLGLTQIMAEELPSLTMAQIQELAASMSKSATNLYRLLENLLQWSRIQQGAISFTPEHVPLNPILMESIEIIQESANRKTIEINTDFTADFTVFADTNLLQTVIRNLVSNAVKFTPKGGKVFISAKSIADNRVEIAIKDTGIGISHDLIENLFKLDVQTNRKGTEGEPSSGLGLLLCKEFVEKHGGTIWVESEVGKGSCFYFTIPT